MDPYRDVIPEDRGEEIRKRVQQRDEAEGGSPPRKRPRASTSSLLPAVPEPQTTNDPPIPESNLEGYDQKRLQLGLRYVITASTRKITPRTQEFLRLAKDAYKVALEVPKPSNESLAVVQALENVYYSGAFYFRREEKNDDYMKLVSLRRLELLANYGDYLGQELQEIRANLKMKAAAGTDPDLWDVALELGPSRSWLKIAAELKGTNMKHLEQQVYVACGVLGIDPNHMKWLIQEWGDRNQCFHNQVRQHIRDCHWMSLAEQVSRDLKELLNVAQDPEVAASYEKVLVSLRDEYFEVIDEDDVQSWGPSAKAKQLSIEKMLRQQKKAGPSKQST